MIGEPPALMWDGVGSQGRGIGGMVVAEPAVDAVLWAVGIASLALAGVVHLSVERRQPRADR